MFPPSVVTEGFLLGEVPGEISRHLISNNKKNLARFKKYSGWYSLRKPENSTGWRHDKLLKKLQEIPREKYRKELWYQFRETLWKIPCEELLQKTREEFLRKSWEELKWTSAGIIRIDLLGEIPGKKTIKEILGGTSIMRKNLKNHLIKKGAGRTLCGRPNPNRNAECHLGRYFGSSW